MLVGSQIKINTIHVRTAESFNSLRLPGGKTVGEVSEGELYRLFEAMGIPNFNHRNSRNANLEAYEKFLDEIAQAGADAAVAHFLAQQKVGDAP